MWGRIWKFLKKIFHRVLFLFHRKPKPKEIVPKIVRLENTVSSYFNEIKDLRSLRNFYANDWNGNLEQIQEIDKKISILRQELFSKNRELRREIAKENLKVLKMR